MSTPHVKPNPVEVYCGNTACPTRQAGKTFRVIDTTEMDDATRAEVLIEGADSFKMEDRPVIGPDGLALMKDDKPVTKEVRVQTSWAKPRYDGELTDGEIWLCPDCTRSHQT